MNAVRRDLADIRLAEYVFAPHYAAPLAMVVRRPVDLRDGPGDGSSVLATCTVGSRFEALDFASGLAWGVATEVGLVGYVALDALERITD